MNSALIWAWFQNLSKTTKLLLITNILTASLMGYAALRVRYFRFQYNRYYEKYAEVYTDYKKIKAELDTIKKTVKPDGGWFRDEGMGNIRAE